MRSVIWAATIAIILAYIGYGVSTWKDYAAHQNDFDELQKYHTIATGAYYPTSERSVWQSDAFRSYKDWELVWGL